MSHELETAAAASLGGFFRRHKDEVAPPGTPCANCATLLMGPWCYACGQVGEDFHRSTLKLLAEGVEGLLHFDSRVWRTLPGLFMNPGRLTRAYLDGHRAPQVPPFRLFLVVLLAIFLAGAISGVGQPGAVTEIKTDDSGKVIAVHKYRLQDLSPQERDAIRQQMSDSFATAARALHLGAPVWLQQRAGRAMEDPERFTGTLERWSERFAFLTLPMAAMLLTLAFLGRRRFYLFDHIIFSLHSLSAVGIMVTATELLAPVAGGPAALILLGAPVHLFFHLRGAYGTGVAGALGRMAFLFAGSCVGVTLILLGWVLVGLNGLGG